MGNRALLYWTAEDIGPTWKSSACSWTIELKDPWCLNRCRRQIGWASGKPLWLGAALLNSSYSYYWDIERDWDIQWFTCPWYVMDRLLILLSVLEISRNEPVRLGRALRALRQLQPL